MKHTYKHRGGKHYLEPSNPSKGRKRGRPKQKIKKSRYELIDGYHIKIPVNKKRSLHRDINQCEPWKLHIPGKHGVPIIRSVEDVIHYQNNPKKLIELFYLAGIIRKSQPCNALHKHQTVRCNGTLHAIYDPHRKGSWSDHGGYYYVCENDGTSPSQCSRGKNNHKRSILKDSFMRGNMSPTKLLKLIYSYAVVSHRVW